MFLMETGTAPINKNKIYKVIIENTQITPYELLINLT